MSYLRSLLINEVLERKVKVISSGIYFPDEVVKSDHLLEEIKSQQNYGLPTNWMSRFLGIDERRMCPIDASPSDLAIPAARMALESCPEINRDHIDAVYFCGIERDQPEPATAHVIQKALGLNARTAIDISNACFGFVNGIEAAIKDIKLGEARYALVVTGEISTKVLRGAVDQLKSGMGMKEARMALGALTVGDAGGAVVLAASDYGDETGFGRFHKKTDSSQYELCIYKMVNGIPTGQMDMAAITKAIFKVHQSMIGSTLENYGWTEFDRALCHQTSSIQFKRIAGLVGLNQQKVVKTFPKYGNITTASFPVGFHKLKNDVTVSRGDRVGCCFSGSGLTIGQFGYTY